MSSPSVSRSGSGVSQTGSRSSVVTASAATSNASTCTQNQRRVSTIVLSDSDDLDEEEQMKLAIMRSLKDSTSPSSASNFISLHVGLNRLNLVDINSNTVQEGHSTPLRKGTVESDTRQTFCCTVLNCEAVFSSYTRLVAHRVKLSHSPCHPCLPILDLETPEHVLSYDCPQCGQQFKDESACRNHQCLKQHKPFLPPVTTCGYMCSQCLTTFSDKSNCQTHMDTLHHTDISYPFEDDFQSLLTCPVPVSLGFIQDFSTQCNKVDFSLYCIDCNSPIECNEEITHRELYPGHIVSASASKSLCEVFLEYLNSCQCDGCGCILSPNEGRIGQIHQCITGYVGFVSEREVRTFAELIRLLGLKFTLQSVGDCVILSSTFNSSGSCAECSMVSVGQPDSSSCNPEVFSDNEDVVVLWSGKTSVEPRERRKRQRSASLEGDIGTGLSSKSHKRARVLRASACSSEKLEDLSKTKFPLPKRTGVLGASARSSDKLEDFSKTKVPLPKRTGVLRASALTCSSDKLEDLSKTKFPSTSVFRAPSNVCNINFPSTTDSSKRPSVEFLSTMKLIIFLDLDNWQSFFKKLPKCLPKKTFVWAFWGGSSSWKEPNGYASFTEQKRNGWFHLHKKSGRTKDAADFALVLQVGSMNELLPKSIPFTILSGDRGFCQVEQELKDTERRLVVIDPHSAHGHSPEVFYTLIISVFQS